MPQNFLCPQRDQPLLMPADMREWLPEDDLVSRRFYSRAHRGMVAFACNLRCVRVGGWLGLPRAWCGVRGPCGAAGGLDGGGLPVTPAGLWDLSPFYSLPLGPDPRVAFCCRERAGQTSACVSLLTWVFGQPVLHYPRS